jgi:hypothetical protein
MGRMSRARRKREIWHTRVEVCQLVCHVVGVCPASCASAHSAPSLARRGCATGAGPEALINALMEDALEEPRASAGIGKSIGTVAFLICLLQRVHRVKMKDWIILSNVGRQ